MTDPADRHLEDRLHALARGVNVPVVPADADVRRGRRRLLRMRLAMTGAITGTLAVVLGITGITAGDPSASEAPIADTPSTSLPAEPTPSQSEEERSTEEEKAGGPAKGAGQPVVTDSSGAVDSGADSGGLRGLAGTGHAPTEDSEPHGGATPEPEPSPSEAVPTSGPTTTSDPTPTTTSDPIPTTTSDPTTEPTSDPSPEPPVPPVPPTETTTVRVHKVLRYYNDVVASHLDPARDHLQPYDRRIDTKETKRSGGKLFALGSTYRWEDGEALDGLEVVVASGWDQLEWQCGASSSDWECHTPTSVDAPVAEVATHDGLLQVAVEHARGQVVVLTADGVELAESELLAAAADDRLKLPGDAPVSPPRIDAETFATAGETALVGDEESFTRTSIDRTPGVRGTRWVEDAARGTLSWSARPVYSGAGWQCLKSYRSCTDLVIDPSGRVVHVAAIKKKLGGGWVIEYDGPEYAVRVTASDQKFPKKRAYAFVTNDAWQRSR